MSQIINLRSVVLCLIASMYFVTGMTTASADILTGLVNRWTFDETSGSIAHDSVGGNDATLSGFPANQPTWIPGKIGGSLNFFAASNYVVTNAPISYNQYTIDFWLQVNGPGGIDPRLVGPRDGEESWVIISAIFNKGVGFYYNHGANLIQDPNPPTNGTWENYAVTIDLTHSLAAVFRDGTQVAAGKFTDHVPLLPWVFGHNQGPTNTNDTLNGQLDDVRIYNRILSNAEIAQLVPEPSSLMLGGCGATAIALWSWTRRKRSGGTTTKPAAPA